MKSIFHWKRYWSPATFVPKRKLCLVLFLLLLFGCDYQPPSHTDTLSALITKTAVSVITVEMDGHSVGSAFAVADNGLFVTNAHIVKLGNIYLKKDANKIRSIQIVAVHPEADLALLRANIKVTPLRLSLQPSTAGESVVALGNPFGLGITATKGIVSAEPKSIGKHFLLQTDAAINPGNSGGPLINRRGEVVGLITSRGAVGSGIGFAIPASIISDMLKDLP